MKQVRKRLESWISDMLGHVGLQPVRRFPYIVRRYRYSPPKGPSHNLGRDYFSLKTLPATDVLPDDLPVDLYSIWSQIPGGHKWLHYFKAYASILDPFRKHPIRMLEIGVYRGGSIRMWRNYLHPDSIIVGLDIDPSCEAYESEKENLYIRIGDQSDPIFLREIVQEFGPFDVILDDGSHICSHMVASFDCLFLDGLKNPGVYIAEDTHCNYWQRFRDQRYSFVDLCQDLVDLMHYHYFHNQSEMLFRKDEPERVPAFSVPRICTEIDEIQFKDSLIAIHKRTKVSSPATVHL